MASKNIQRKAINDDDNTPLYQTNLFSEDNVTIVNVQQQNEISFINYLQTILAKLRTYEKLMYFLVLVLIISFLGKLLLAEKPDTKISTDAIDINKMNVSQNQTLLKIEDKSDKKLQIQPIKQESSPKIEKPQSQPIDFLKQVRQHEMKASGIIQQQLQTAKKNVKMIELDLNQTNEQIKKEKEYYQQKYNISKYQELSFCVIVPTYNNALDNRSTNNIKSIIMQDYKNFHVTIVNDASSDKTGEIIQEFLKKSQFNQSRYKLITNQKQMFTLYNIRKAAIQSCKPNQIIVVVDGDDFLIGRQVFKFFNAVIQQRGLWFVYSNYLSSDGQLGASKPYPQRIISSNSYRTQPLSVSHLRAFYAQLFLNIKEQDFKNQKGQYIKSACDVAMILPMLQQSQKRAAYIPEITYYYNADTGFNNHQIRAMQQQISNSDIRSKRKYSILQNLYEIK